MLNRTNKKDPIDRGHSVEKAQLELLRPIWQGRQDLNLQPTVLETATLPLSYSPI